MKFTVRHAIPGRIRLHIPVLEQPSELATSVVEWLEELDWIRSARVNHAAASLILEYDPAQSSMLTGALAMLRAASLDDLACLVAMSGPVTPAVPEQKVVQKDTGRWPLALPTLSLGMAMLSNPVLSAVNVPLMLYNSLPIFRRAWHVLRDEKRMNIDFLDTLAILASIGQNMMVTGGIIVWLIRLGDWIRDMTAAGSRKAIDELLEFQGKTAWRVVDGQVVSVPVNQIEAGDLIQVHHGEMIPVDGTIVKGRAMVDQKTITGESLPITRSEDEAAFAGTIVKEGQLIIRADRVGTETMAAQIAKLVSEAPIGDTRMQNHAEKFADRLVAPTLGLAVGTAAVTADFNRFLSLVIVDFGTGVRVSAPTAILSSMTYAARRGIIVKSGRHMERLTEVDTVIFDKTGTLTHGTPAVRQLLTYQNTISPPQLLGIAAAAETKLKHPVAEALRTKATEMQLVLPDCDQVAFNVGLGVQGQVNGWYVHVGSERFMRESGIKLDRVGSDRADLNEQGESCVFVAVDGSLAGLVSYADQIRDESRQVIERLRALGVRETIMLTGDNDVVASAVARRLGLTGHFANLMPSDKSDTVGQLQREGRIVAMVGDGINDSPALSYADVGIAMKHGADIAHESADVVLLEDSLWKLVETVEISRDAVRLIRQNYGIVGALNALALGLVLPGGIIPPHITALLSNGSAILAALNGMRPLLRSR